jgi:hypothetical protein
LSVTNKDGNRQWIRILRLSVSSYSLSFEPGRTSPQVIRSGTEHLMHLYLSEAPRTLYLVTGSQDDKLGRPRRALVFRASPTNASQAVVEFLQRDDLDLSSAVSMTSRTVKGCLGLINVGGGAPFPSIVHTTTNHSQTYSWPS